MHNPTRLLYLLSASSLIQAIVIDSPSSSISTCAYTPIASPPPKLRCLEQGTLKKPNELSAIKKSTKTGCRDSCMINQGCISFGFDTSSKLCTLYRSSLGAQGFKESETSVVFANRHCFACEITTTSTITFSTSTTTSISTTTTSVPPALSTFQIQASNSGTAADGTSAIGTEAIGDALFNVEFNPNAEFGPTTYILGFNGTLVTTDGNYFLAAIGDSGDPYPITEVMVENQQRLAPLICSVDAGSQGLVCEADISSMLVTNFQIQDEGDDIYILYISAGSPNVTLTAVPPS